MVVRLMGCDSKSNRSQASRAYFNPALSLLNFRCSSAVKSERTSPQYLSYATTRMPQCLLLQYENLRVFSLSIYSVHPQLMTVVVARKIVLQFTFLSFIVLFCLSQSPSFNSRQLNDMISSLRRFSNHIYETPNYSQ